MEKQKNKLVTIEIVEKDINIEIKTLTSYVSTRAIDRDGEVVNPDLIDDTNYQKNPVVLFQHDTNCPVGKSLWRKTDSIGYMSQTQFAQKGLGAEIFDLYQQKILNAFSIGFMPLESGKFVDNIFNYGKVELLEYSAVSVPANPEAVTLGFIKGLTSPVLKTALINDYLLDIINKEVTDLSEIVKNIKSSEPIDYKELVKNEIDSIYKNEIEPKLQEMNKLLEDLKLQKYKLGLEALVKEVIHEKFK